MTANAIENVPLQANRRCNSPCPGGSWFAERVDCWAIDVRPLHSGLFHLGDGWFVRKSSNYRCCQRSDQDRRIRFSQLPILVVVVGICAASKTTCFVCVLLHSCTFDGQVSRIPPGGKGYPWSDRTNPPRRHIAILAPSACSLYPPFATGLPFALATASHLCLVSLRCYR